MAFFIGLIVGIIPLIFAKVKESGCWYKPFNLKGWALVLLPFFALVLLSLLKPEDVQNPAEVISNIGFPFMLFILLAGIIAAAALIIPGISGSFMLLLMGIYRLFTYSLSSIGTLLTEITNTSLMLDIVKVLGPLAIGIIIGGLSMARLIEKLLKNHHKTTYTIILGLLFGSVYVLFNDPSVFQSGSSVLHVIIGAITFCLGIVLSFNLGKKQF
jgi:putative membrane protein